MTLITLSHSGSDTIFLAHLDHGLPFLYGALVHFSRKWYLATSMRASGIYILLRSWPLLLGFLWTELGVMIL